jgi:hypothetical protein
MLLRKFFGHNQRATMSTYDSDSVRYHKAFVARKLSVARLALNARSCEWSASYGAPENNIANWISGRNYPDPLFLKQICDDTGLTMDWFYRGIMAGVQSALVEPLKDASSKIPQTRISAGRGRPKILKKRSD